MKVARSIDQIIFIHDHVIVTVDWWVDDQCSIHLSHRIVCMYLITVHPSFLATSCMASVWAFAIYLLVADCLY